MTMSTSRVIEEIEKLKEKGEISEDTYIKLKKAVENPIRIDLGKIFRKFGMSNRNLILDIAAGGSGTGPKVLGRQTVALDISKTEIGSAKNEGALAQWVCADATKLPFKEETFDFAFTFIGLAYIKGKENKLMTLKETYRVLRSGGILLLIEPEISENVKDYMEYYVVCKDGKIINETIFGVSGAEITQTLEMLSDMLQHVKFKVHVEARDRYFIIAGRKL